MDANNGLVPHVARVIQEELLEDFANRPELSDWFGRQETTPPAVVVKKPNPRNIQNAEKIKELEEQIHKYAVQCGSPLTCIYMGNKY